MAFKKRTQDTAPAPQAQQATSPTPTETANSRPWRTPETAPAPAKGDKSKLVQVAGMFMNEKNGKQYFRGKTLKAVEAYGVVIPAGITFLLFESDKGKVDGNLVITLDTPK